jgi:hypothetical protein
MRGRWTHAECHRHIGRHNTHSSSLVVRVFPARPRNRSRCHRCEQPLPLDAPSTGWVTALAGLLARGSLPFVQPSRISDFAETQWLYADEGSPLTVAGAATEYCDLTKYKDAATVFPLSSPERPGEPTRAGSFLRPISESRRRMTCAFFRPESRRFERHTERRVTENVLPSVECRGGRIP